MRPTEDTRIVVSSLLLLSAILYNEALARKRAKPLSEAEMVLTILQFAERKSFDGSKKPGGHRDL